MGIFRTAPAFFLIAFDPERAKGRFLPVAKVSNSKQTFDLAVTQPRYFLIRVVVMPLRLNLIQGQLVKPRITRT